MKNMNSLRRSYIVTKFFTYFFLILGAVIMVFPFVWMILTSSKTVPESMQIPPTIFPRQVMLDNFKEAIASLPFANLYWNTILMVFFRVVCAILFSSMAGYAFAKLQFRGKKLLFWDRADSDVPAKPDFHYPAIPDGCQNGHGQYDFRPGLSGSGQRLRCVLPAAGLYEYSG